MELKIFIYLTFLHINVSVINRFWKLFY